MHDRNYFVWKYAVLTIEATNDSEKRLKLRSAEHFIILEKHVNNKNQIIKFKLSYVIKI